MKIYYFTIRSVSCFHILLYLFGIMHHYQLRKCRQVLRAKRSFPLKGSAKKSANNENGNAMACLVCTVDGQRQLNAIITIVAVKTHRRRCASLSSVKFINWLSRADWKPSRLGGPQRSSFKQGGSGHQDSSSSASQSVVRMTSSEHSHEISIKKQHLAKDKTPWWCELRWHGVTVTLMRSSVCETIPERGIGGLFMWNNINLLYRFNSLPPFLLHPPALTINANINELSQLL